MRAFLQERRAVERGGRRYTVRPPSVRCVWTFLGLFGLELREVAKSLAEAGLGGDFDPAAAVPFLVGDDATAGRVAEVLDCAVVMHGGAPGELQDALQRDRDLRVQLGQALVALTDVPEIVEALGLTLEQVAELGAEDDQDDQGEGGREPVSDHELAVCLVAAHFGCAPHDVTEWPFAEWHRVVHDVLPLLDPGGKAEALSPAQAPAARLDGLPGVGAHSIGGGGAGGN